MHYLEKVERLVVMDAQIPGIEPWTKILQNPGVWHFNLQVATNVREAAVSGSGHWLMEELPSKTAALIRGFDDASPEEHLTPTEYTFPAHANPGTGSSGIASNQTVVLNGDPDRAGVYTIKPRGPALTRIAAHSHRDDRIATVISVTWRIGYRASSMNQNSKLSLQEASTRSRRGRCSSRRPRTSPMLFRSPDSVHLPPTISKATKIPAISPNV
jgi:hypothetical protein